MANILVIDDVKALLRSVKKMLVRGGFSVTTADNGSEGLILAQESMPDLVLVDAVMPGLDGPTLCRTLKKSARTRHIPVIIMSGEMVEERDIIAGLDGGADDYVLKPFPMKVLQARINAVLRRYDPAAAAPETLEAYGLELNPGAREVRVHGKQVALTRKEFDLLALMLARPGRVLSKNFLLETVWGYDLATYNDPHTVETHVSLLRKKLGAKFSKHIESVRGYGYKLVS